MKRDRIHKPWALVDRSCSDHHDAIALAIDVQRIDQQSTR